ncbi:hypothetical protein ACOSP7_014447 [Xanthoceras sorbifolium]
MRDSTKYKATRNQVLSNLFLSYTHTHKKKRHKRIVNNSWRRDKRILDQTSFQTPLFLLSKTPSLSLFFMIQQSKPITRLQSTQVLNLSLTINTNTHTYIYIYIYIKI